jgi:hypothetical protein
MKFKKGDKVKQVVPVISGEIKDAKIVDGDHVQYLVVYASEDGATERWFHENHLALASEVAK